MTASPPSSRRRAGFEVALTGAILLALSLSVMDWVHFRGLYGRRSDGLRFLEMGDHLSIVHIGMAAAYFGGLGLLLAALTAILALLGTRPGDRRLAVRWAAVLLALGAALLQIVVMASVSGFEDNVGPWIGSYVGLGGYAVLCVAAAIGPAHRP